MRLYFYKNGGVSNLITKYFQEMAPFYQHFLFLCVSGVVFTKKTAHITSCMFCIASSLNTRKKVFIHSPIIFSLCR